MYFERLAQSAPHCEATYRVREGELPPMNARIAKAGRVLGYVHRLSDGGKWLATTDSRCTDAASGERKTRGEAAAALPIIARRPPTRALRASAQKWTVQVWSRLTLRRFKLGVATDPLPFVNALAFYELWHRRLGLSVNGIAVDKVTMEPVHD